KSYRNRIQDAANSISSFMVNIVLQPHQVKFVHTNYYWNREVNNSHATQYKLNQFPVNYALYFSEDPNYPGYADTVSILTYMHSAETQLWQHTHNRTANPTDRNIAYQEWKLERSETLINKVAER